DERNIRLAILVQRRRHADDDGPDFLDTVEIGRGREPSGLDHISNGLRRDVFDVAAALVQRIDLGLVYIQAQDRDARSCELKRQGQAHVTQADNCDTHSFVIHIKQSSINHPKLLQPSDVSSVQPTAPPLLRQEAIQCNPFQCVTNSVQSDFRGKAKKTVDRTAEAALISPGWIEKEKAESG